MTTPMWSGMLPDPRHRCLIPLTAFAEPAGARGGMTRTWVSVAGEPIFAWAGIWRNTEAWGPVYGGVMTQSNEAVAPFSPSMPVLLRPDDYEQWLHCGIDGVTRFVFRTYPAKRLSVVATRERWLRRIAAAPTALS